MTVLPDDERTVLAVFAAADEPYRLMDVLDVLNPRPAGFGPRRSGKRAAGEAWLAREQQLVNAWADLLVADLLRVVQARRTHVGGTYAITEAGRAALTELAEPFTASGAERSQ